MSKRVNNKKGITNRRYNWNKPKGVGQRRFGTDTRKMVRLKEVFTQRATIPSRAMVIIQKLGKSVNDYLPKNHYRRTGAK